MQIKKPTILLLESATLFTPRPVSELDAAATKVQKVYKSYRTRRDLADCAALVEELWWQTLDFAALKRSSVSFYNIEKHGNADRSGHGLGQGLPIGKGLCKDEKAQKLSLEALTMKDLVHYFLRLFLAIGTDTICIFYHDVWSNWLDVGDGKYTNLNKCPRSPGLQRQCIQYLGPKERGACEVIVENGKLVHRQSGMLVDTVEESKWIFELSTSRSSYVGQKKKGTFQHSNFVSEGATTKHDHIHHHP